MDKHPKLISKFKLLYELQLNPNIHTNSDLARKIGISKQSVSKWCRGTNTSRGNSIPIKEINTVAKIFSIEPDWFSLEFEKFESRVRERLEKVRRNSSETKISTATLPITSIHLFGRESELKRLKSFWSDPGINMVEVVAFGGAGKSSLINKWLSELHKEQYLDAQRVYAWSFHWQGQSHDVGSKGDYFIEHALDWFGDGNPAEGTPWSKATRLASLIRSSRTLLILDGLEPLQAPPGSDHGSITSTALSLLVKDLASHNNGLCVITSRYSVPDLAAYRDGRNEKILLPRLSNKSGVEMLKSFGLVGSQNHYSEAVESYSGHALSLTLLAGYIGSAYSGNLNSISGKISIVEDESAKNQVDALMHDYLNLLKDRAELQVLRVVSLLERNTTIEEIYALAKTASIVGLTDQLSEMNIRQLKVAISNLRVAQLVSIDDESDATITCHSLVRESVSIRLETDEHSMWLAGQGLIFDFMKSRAVDNPENIRDFEPLFRAVIHGANSGRVDEAFSYYFEKVKKKYSMSLGSQAMDLSCIQSFFDDDWENPKYVLPDDSKYFLLSSAATNLMALGHLEDSIKLSFKCISFFSKQGRWLEASLTAGPLISMLIESGKLSQALELLDELNQHVSNSNNPVLQAMAKNFQAYAFFLNGRNDEAGLLFEEVEDVLNLMDPGVIVNFPTVSSYYCKYLLEIGNTKASLERCLKTSAWRRLKSWQVSIDTNSILASDLLVLGQVFQKLGDRANAKKYLDQQVALFRSADEWLYLPTGLNSRARFFMEIHDFENALRDLRESIEISRRTGARYGEWEALLELAQLHRKRNELEYSADYLSKAKCMSGMEHYKFKNEEIAELERTLNLH